jgi:hypothetical protein
VPFGIEPEIDEVVDQVLNVTVSPDSEKPGVPAPGSSANTQPTLDALSACSSSFSNSVPGISGVVTGLAGR